MVYVFARPLRLALLGLFAAATLVVVGCGGLPEEPSAAQAHAAAPTATAAQAKHRSRRARRKGSALAALDRLAGKGRASRTGYDREQFGTGWASLNGCDTRERILARDLRRTTGAS